LSRVDQNGEQTQNERTKPARNRIPKIHNHQNNTKTCIRSQPTRINSSGNPAHAHLVSDIIYPTFTTRLLMALDLVVPPQRICIRRRCSTLTRPHPSALRRLYDISPSGPRMLFRRRLRRARPLLLLRLLLRRRLSRRLLCRLRACCGAAAADGAVSSLWGRVRAGSGAGGGRGWPAAHVVDLHVPVGAVHLLVAEVRVRGDDVLRAACQFSWAMMRAGLTQAWIRPGR
jgi:hypothetical protein